MKRILVILLLLLINISHSQERSETIKSLSNRDFKIYMSLEKNIVFFEFCDPYKLSKCDLKIISFDLRGIVKLLDKNLPTGTTSVLGNGKIIKTENGNLSIASFQGDISEKVFLDNAQEPRLLEGIPFAIKEEFAFKNSCRSSSSKIFKDRIDNYTDIYIQRLLDQGSIPLFKTTTPEFCLLGTTWSDLHGITTNPWNKKYTPGGSSGGSGAALATGACAIASGSDIGGSIRIPAAACGVFGYKPPYGRNPEVPYGNLDYYSHSGPMARSVEDIILMQLSTAGIHNQDIASMPKPEDFDGNSNLKNIKIAWSDHLCGFEVEDDIVTNMKNALNLLEENGATVEYVDLKLPDNILDAAGTYLTALWGTSLKEIAKGKEELLCAYTQKFIEKNKITKIHSATQYKRYNGLMKEYVSTFIKMKIENSGVKTQEECDELIDLFEKDPRKIEGVTNDGWVCNRGYYRC